MKINKVEIEAFRAFNEKEDSTFDFTLADNSTANFISIYAPNGYGKTSFYDAVEWAATSQITRFARNYIENRKNGIENRKHNKNQYLLQHNGQLKLGSVKIITDSSKIKFNKKNISSSKVYNFSKKGKNLYFKDVILSQELIDSFIKMDKAEERYREFVKNIPALDRHNTGLQNLIRLNETIKAQLADAEDKRGKLEQKQIDFDYAGTESIMVDINKSISSLINNKEELKHIEKGDFSEEKLKGLTQKVNARISGVNSDISIYKEQINKLETDFDGNDNKIGVISYYQLRDKVELLNNEKRALTNFIQLFKDKSANEKSILSLNKRLDNIVDANKRLSSVDSQFNSFLDIQAKIAQLRKDKEDKTKELRRAHKDEKNFEKISNNISIDLNKLDKELLKEQTKLDKLPSIEKRIKEINDLKKDVLKQSEVVLSSLSKEQENKIKLEKDIFELEHSLMQINESAFDSLDRCIYLKEKTKELELIRKYATETSELNKDLNAILKQVNDQQDLNTELESLVSKGLDILNVNESKTCPLCSANYNSFKELSERITKNPLLAKGLKESLRQKVDVEKRIKNIEDQSLKLINTIKFILNESLKQKQKEKNELNALLERYKKTKEGLDKRLRDLNKENQDIINYLNNQTPEIFLKNTTESIKEKKEKKGKLQEDKDSALSFKKEKDVFLKKITSEIELIEKEIENELKSNLYLSTTTYFIKVLKTDKIDKEQLRLKKELITQEEKEINKLISESKRKADELHQELISNDLNKEQLNEKIILVNKELDKITTSIKNFEIRILNDYKIVLSEIDLDKTRKAFEDRKRSIKNSLELSFENLKHYKIIEKLKDDTYSFLQSEETKVKLKQKIEEIKTLKRTRQSLNKERENLEAYLKRTIDNFFYTDIINSIYSKIDPHPDYDRIEFDCDFKDNSPRLQIYTIDKDGNKAIPALYFSSAQTNILSLSIFLAKALKAEHPETKELIDCIFVDDPIQSMDSINVLSFIDLFRSLTVNLNKQIIVSTHEENFHLLLQKKMPSELFKSKFMELETFGKVKTEN